MERLKVETERDAIYNRHKVTGFTEEEMKQIANGGEDELVRILDERNGGLGTCWGCGYGIYGLRIADGAVYVKTGNSCD